MFDKYFQRKRIINQILDELRFTTTPETLTDLPFEYEIKNNFLFIRRKEAPTAIIYNVEKNTFKIHCREYEKIADFIYYKRMLQALIMAHAELTKRDKLLTRLNIPLNDINKLN